MDTHNPAVSGTAEPHATAARPELTEGMREALAALDAEIIEMEKSLRRPPCRVVLNRIARGKGHRDELLATLRPYNFETTAETLQDILDKHRAEGLIRKEKTSYGTTRWVLTEKGKVLYGRR